MTRPLTLREFLQRAEEKRRTLGLAPEDDEALRNKGDRRTPEKLELLKRAEARARAAGRKPIVSHY